MDKKQIISKYNLEKNQINLIDTYLLDLEKKNNEINLVGKSTLTNSWDRHVNDSLQLSLKILNKKSSIIDLGTGAGIPGIILAIFGYKNILLTDSKLKKINFINSFCKKNKVVVKTRCSRVENIKNQKFDFIICRAFAPLKKILDYSLIFSKKNTSLLLLKGRNVKNEILDAKKHFKFQYELSDSQSLGGGFVLEIKHLDKLWLK